MRVPLYSVQGVSSGKVSIMARPRGGDWLLDEMKALHDCGVDILISLLTASEVSELDLGGEAECCVSQGIIYLSFAIPDRCVPSFSAQTFRLIELLHEHLSAGKHIVFHCRHGLGRAVLMAASLLVLTGIAPEQAFEQLSQVRGYTVPETDE
jgi:hypothetical protein